MNLPSFIRQPAIALIGDTCYISLIEQLDYTDVTCIKYSISKGLGLGIVVGGSIVKIPQILTIVSHGSAQGVSLLSYLLEISASTTTLAYNIRQANPFSTFGEVLFVTLQNLIIVGLILFYSKQSLYILPLYALVFALFYGLQQPNLVPSTLMASLYAATIPLTLASKVPQIWSNFKNKSTGQLSVFAVVNYFLGTSARVFTTWTELDDPLMLLGMLLATGLNFILVLQVLLYWGKSPASTSSKKNI
ncbi:uncharacterized protein BX664DRAFT_338600 [Halteromyces radiatus]|uniref:uncharacterized protein n=1 Tax=Halteromyces radiatus TaxID=101107 RepID=UPI002220073A|nr:uncharacterized protein BX664DRAFT_338600 [Halteromyces radiatus]KAI8085135.1 hypothetical protein BX664DRAFT_338600 [Halteromyces radiatus]